MRSASMIVGMFVLAAGIEGMIEASTTYSPLRPRTAPVEFTTAMRSVLGPIGQVPTGCGLHKPYPQFDTSAAFTLILILKGMAGFRLVNRAT